MKSNRLKWEYNEGTREWTGSYKERGMFKIYFHKVTKMPVLMYYENIMSSFNIISSFNELKNAKKVAHLIYFG